jgi:AraC-like DNA-binding protein
MTHSYRTLGIARRGEDARFDASVGAIGFVLHRHRPANWVIEDLANPHYNILAFALEGRALYRCGDQRFDATRGTMLLFPRGVSHSARSDPKAPWSFYSVGFRLDRAGAGFDELPNNVRLPNVTQISDYFRELDRLWTRRQPGYVLACRGLILLLIQQFIAAAEQARPRLPHARAIEELVTEMHRNVGRVVSVGALARKAGLSPSRFRLLFHELTGCSVTRYQNRLRIEAARDRLASGQFSVGQVADELGFRDVYYFSRLFKRMTGLPPSACRHG